MMENKKGSLLIGTLWLVVVLGVISTSLLFNAGSLLQLMERRLERYELKMDFMTILNWKTNQILTDSRPYEDSKNASWYGEETIRTPNDKSYRVVLTDEESRLNLNYMEQHQLKTFLAIWQQYTGNLIGKEDDFVTAVTAHEKPFLSYEELYLEEDVFGEDLEALRDSVTVYTATMQLNINTVSMMTLEAILEALNVDDFAKNDFLEAMQEMRRNQAAGNNVYAFGEEDLYPRTIREKLDMDATPQNINLFSRLIPLLKVDSSNYRMHVFERQQLLLECIFSIDAVTEEISIRTWYEPQAA